MRSTVQQTFSAAAGGTQYVSLGGSAGADVSRFDYCGWSIDHPAATTTVYTVQGSHRKDSVDDWHDLSSPAPVSKAAAEKFSINVIQNPYARLRLRAVTSGGTSVITVSQTTKGPY